MIAQGDFLKLLLAPTEDRKKIFQKLFKTQNYYVLQEKLKSESGKLSREYDAIKKSIEQYINGIMCDEDDVLSIQVKKAKSNELSVSEIVLLAEELIKNDEIAEGELDAKIKHFDKELEEITKLLTKAQTLKSAKTSLETAQTELADAVANRPKAVTPELFVGKTITDASGNTDVITKDVAQEIWLGMRMEGYIDKQGTLTDKYYADKANGEIKLADEVAGSAESVIGIIDTIYDGKAMQPENARSNNVELQVKPAKLAMPEFKALWNRINSKSVYVVDFDTDELVRKTIISLNAKLRVSKIYFKVESGRMDNIASKEALASGSAFTKTTSQAYGAGNKIAANSSVKYDLVGKLVDATGLTRKAIIQILTGIEKFVFDQFKDNPEEFIIKAGALINDEKATAIIEHITYDVLDERYDTDVFTAPTIKGKLGVNTIKANKHLYDHIVYDSSNEKAFAESLDVSTDVAVYVKLPDGFYISTPVGHYNPDWAIAFYEGNIKHIYFVAETKGSMNSMQLRMIEDAKIHCAREHFTAISSGNVVYDVVDSYQSLLNKVMR
jgi:type III restriction enzyme